MYDYCHKHFPEKFWGRPLLLKAHVTCWVVTQYTVNSTFHRHYALWDSMLTTGYIKPNSRLYVLHRIWSIKHLQHEKFNNQRPWLGLPSGDFIVPDEGNWIFVTSLLVPTSLHPLEIHPSMVSCARFLTSNFNHIPLFYVLATVSQNFRLPNKREIT